MFQRILIPTDGSKVGRKAIGAGIAFAKELGASVVGYCAAEAIERVFYADGASVRPVAIKQFLQESMAEHGRKYLAEIAQACKAAGVACETVMTSPATPWTFRASRMPDGSPASSCVPRVGSAPRCRSDSSVAQRPWSIGRSTFLSVGLMFRRGLSACWRRSR